MKTVAVPIAVLAGLALASPAAAHHARAGACGLPPAKPLFVEYGASGVSPAIREGVFARPGLVVATAGREVASRLRSAGARTAYWEMNLHRLVGRSSAPADPATVDAAADRLLARAAADTACGAPAIALNELEGARLPTPWSQNLTRYRDNVLRLLRRLHARGARPYLLVTTTPAPYTASEEAAAWWREAAAAGEIVLQLHFSGRHVASKGPVEGSRLRRQKMRRVVARLAAAGVPPARLGLLHGLQSGSGGRAGLPLRKWLRVVKWEALAAKQVAAELEQAGTPLGSVWSWGWGDFPKLSPADPAKPVTACVYLWARDPSLCDGPARAAAAGVRFETSLAEGQLALAAGVQCDVAGGSIPQFAVGELAGVVGTRAALDVLFAGLVESTRGSVTLEAVAAAEETVVGVRFGGSRAAYEQALLARGLTAASARALIADQVRRRLLEQFLGPTGYRRWTVAEQKRVLARTTCLGDDVPRPGVVDVAALFPFLALP